MSTFLTFVRDVTGRVKNLATDVLPTAATISGSVIVLLFLCSLFGAAPPATLSDVVAFLGRAIAGLGVTLAVCGAVATVDQVVFQR
jgi:hypothetical protein